MAVFFIQIMLGDLIYPTVALALTSGPAQPEFTSFEPVVTTNMVNEFTGDLTYNLPVLEIPGPNGGGYALSLSYHGGASPEEEASWVGAGWTLNPGAINRQLNGVPDDWNGTEQMRYWNRTAPSRTLSISGYISPEAMQWDIPVSANASLSYNNYRGFGYVFGAGVSNNQGTVSLGYHLADGNSSFSLTINPAAQLNQKRKELIKEVRNDKEQLKEAKTPKEAEVLAANLAMSKKALQVKGAHSRSTIAFGAMSSAYLNHAVAGETFPMEMQPGNGYSSRLTVGLNGTFLPVEVGFQGNVSGSYAVQRTDEFIEPYIAGYLYSTNVNGEDDWVMDYHSENPTTFNKRDVFLPPAFNDHDMYVATGEGIMGSMRLHSRVPAMFRPAKAVSTSYQTQIGGETDLGWASGGSIDINLGGMQQLVMDGGSGVSSSTVTDEPYYFRMSGDMGGWVGYDGNSSQPANANVSVSGVPGFLSASFDDHNISTTSGNGGERAKRSSYVGHSLYSTSREKRYEKRTMQDIVSQGLPPTDISLTTSPIEHQIAELSVLNESGQRYNYGLPVRSLKESALSYSYHAGDVEEHRYKFIDPGTNYDADNGTFKTGTSGEARYATTYLLTSILSPDYVDRTGDGATDDDLGGFTRFCYAAHQNEQSGGGAYHWRMPYKGYMYRDSELSECHDDRISYSEGTKEIYYLDRVETKSHVAVFHRSARLDAKGVGPSALSGHELAKLDRIELFAKNDMNTPIKTVHFRYDYETWTKLHNSFDSSDPQTLLPRLTLKKVWFEYNGIVPATIAPYDFHYTYALPYAYPQPYGPVDATPIGMPTMDETPDYSIFGTDAWGNYGSDANGDRSMEHEYWVDQSPAATYDPAAWQLKRIVLPSGGEIHIQYEQDDYAFVQNEKAHAMVPLWDPDPDTPQNPMLGIDNTFILDVSELVGTNSSGTDAPAEFTATDIADQIRSFYSAGRPIFFNLMYLLRGSNFNFGGRNAEFIKGYAQVDAVSGDNTLNTVTIQLVTGTHTLPYNVCKDLFNATKRGKMLTGANCTTGGDPFNDQYVDWGVAESSAEHAINGFVGALANLGSFVSSFDDPTVCATIAGEHSWFRIPVGKRKLGGGLRVSRLLMVDPSTDAVHYARVYGTEYIYRTVDEAGRSISSGVATNEPGTLREENVLVRPLDRHRQSFLNRIIAGRDRKQTEGPLGESVYPGASVGYSKVLSKNIHSSTLVDDDLLGKTAPAFSVQEFHTYKDHPIVVDQTDMDKRNDYLPIITGIVDIIRNNVYVSQGYTIHKPNMHGRQKRQASYGGDHRAQLGWSNVFATTLGSVEYEYFDRNEELPVITPGWLPGAAFDHLPLGREMDISIEKRRMKEDNNDGSIELGFDIAPLPAPPFVMVSFSGMPSVSHNHMKSETHTITKVIEYPAVVKRTKIFKDGIYHITENLAFDPSTGDPAVTRTHDGFTPAIGSPSSDPTLADTPGSGIYTSVRLPASMIYPDMGQVAKGEHKHVVASCTLPNGICIDITEVNTTDNTAVIRLVAGTGSGAAICDLLKALCTGDQIELQASSNGSAPFSPYIYYMTRIDGSDIHLLKAGGSGVLPVNGGVGSLYVVRSGCDNKLREQAGGYTMYGTPNTQSLVEWTDRMAFVQLLNDHIDDAISAAPGDYLVTGAAAPMIIDPATGECKAFPGRLYLFMDGADLFVEPRGFCNPSLAGIPGHFDLDVEGMLIFYEAGNNCFGRKVECPQFCGPIIPDIGIDNVVACNATQYSAEWPYETDDYGPNAQWPQDQNDYELGRTGNWRAQSHHTYMAPLEVGQYNYEQGMFTMQYFNWLHPEANAADKWVTTDRVTQYSPDGNALEEVDALGRPSCARYGYSRMLPYLIAKNSALEHTQFESFEIGGGHCEQCMLVAGTTWDNTKGHAGKASVKNATGQPHVLYASAPMDVTPAIVGSGLRVQAWFRSMDGTSYRTAVVNAGITSPTLGGTTNIPVDLNCVARSGEWELFEGKAQVPPTWVDVQISVASADLPTSITWIDDVRIQPMDAQMSTYVYDPKTLRLLATFDDQHFGLYYQYNAEGKLVRKLVETTRGIRTITDSQSNTPLREIHPTP